MVDCFRFRQPRLPQAVQKSFEIIWKEHALVARFRLTVSRTAQTRLTDLPPRSVYVLIHETVFRLFNYAGAGGKGYRSNVPGSVLLSRRARVFSDHMVEQFREKVL